MTDLRRVPWDSSGAAMIELAMVLPLILMLVVGMVSAAIAYNHELALSHSAREGGRFGATLPIDNYASTDAWLDVVAQAVGDDATGTLGPGAPGRYICVAFVHPAGNLASDTTRRRVETTGAPVYSDAECFSDGRPDSERRVQVQVRRDTEFSVAFFSTTLTLESDGVSRFEAAIGG
ncbi:MAG: TadE family protein [Acidimicrobiia bacterium]|nr:TadE family protein [Acidimicrobiia bacterium]